MGTVSFRFKDTPEDQERATKLVKALRGNKPKKQKPIMEWKKGPIPEDGKTYVTATQWLTKNEKSSYEFIVAYVDEEGRFCDGEGEEIFSHSAEDVDWYLPIPPIPQE